MNEYDYTLRASKMTEKARYTFRLLPGYLSNLQLTADLIEFSLEMSGRNRIGEE